MNRQQEKEIAMLAKAGAEFAAKELAAEREQNDRFPFGPFWAKALEKAEDLGFFHLALSEELGGFGGALAPLCALLSALARTDASLAATALVQAAAHTLAAEAGAAALVEALAAGEEGSLSGRMFALPLFSDPTESPCALRAKNGAEGTVLTGELPYLVLARRAGHALVFAEEEEGLSLFLADLSAKGMSLSPDVFSLGIHACPAADAGFDSVPAQRLGAPGKGEEYFSRAAARMLAPAAAVLEGIMQGSFRDALAYAKKREQGGRRILDWSEVRMILSTMAMRAKNAEALVASAAGAADSGRSGWEEQALAAFIRVAEDACLATGDGIQIFGGVGYMKDYPQEKRFRDAQHMQAAFGLLPLKKLCLLERMAGL